MKESTSDFRLKCFRNCGHSDSISESPFDPMDQFVGNGHAALPQTLTVYTPRSPSLKNRPRRSPF
jgi:hypothetical protein